MVFAFHQQNEIIIVGLVSHSPCSATVP